MERIANPLPQGFVGSNPTPASSAVVGLAPAPFAVIGRGGDGRRMTLGPLRASNRTEPLMLGRRVLCVLATLGFCSFVRADPPRVVAASPDHGDTGVDPATNEVRIEFDQAMSPAGQSICGGGPRFPKLSGQPRWTKTEDGVLRVLVLPVLLAPEHQYELSVNCASFQGTRSAAGEAAEITQIRFATGPEVKPGTAMEAKPALTPEQNRAAVAALRTAIDTQYSYRDRVVADWPSRFAAAAPLLEAAKTRAAFARVAARLLEPANDLHLNLRVGEAYFPTARGGPAPNINTASVAKAVPGFKWKAAGVATGRFEDGVGYIMLTGWPSDAGLIAPALAALDEWRDAPGVVIDVRGNGGGDERTARVFASRFVRTKAVYSKSEIKTPQGVSGPFERTIEPGPAEQRFGGKAVVLVGPGCMSSNESFVLMMRYGAGAMLVGDRTRGSSGNPKPHDLGNGVTALVPSWRDLLPDGTPLEGTGVEPDLRVPVNAKQLEAGDPVIEAGVAKVRQK